MRKNAKKNLKKFEKKIEKFEKIRKKIWKIWKNSKKNLKILEKNLKKFEKKNWKKFENIRKKIWKNLNYKENNRIWILNFLKLELNLQIFNEIFQDSVPGVNTRTQVIIRLVTPGHQVETRMPFSVSNYSHRTLWNNNNNNNNKAVSLLFQ